MFFLLIMTIAQSGNPHSWEWVEQHIDRLPSAALQSAQLERLRADQMQVQATRSVRLQSTLAASATTDPVAVFGGKLGNAEFQAEDFAIFSDSGIDTFPVNHPQTFSDTQLRLDLSYRLWDGGVGRAQLQQLDRAIAAQHNQASDQRQRNWVEFAMRHHDLKAFEQIRATALEIRAASAATRSAIQALFDEGQIAKTRVLQAEAEWAYADAQVAASQAQMEAAISTFAAWLNVSLADVQRLPIPPAAPQVDTPAPTFAERAAQAQLDASLLGEKTVAPNWQPTIDFSANHTTHQLSQDHWWAGVQATWDLFDGGRRKARRANLRSAVTSAKAEAEAVSRQMAQQRLANSSQLHALRAQCQAITTQIGALQHVVDTQSALLKEGQLQSTTLFESRRQLLQASQQLVELEARIEKQAWQAHYFSGADIQVLMTERTANP